MAEFEFQGGVRRRMTRGVELVVSEQVNGARARFATERNNIKGNNKSFGFLKLQDRNIGCIVNGCIYVFSIILK